jgi:hypothetical protein
MKGPLGLTESIVDLGAGWLRTIAGPQSCRTLTVLWHEPCALAQAPQPANAGTSPASQAQPGSVSIEAITSLDQLPCTWTGISHGSLHYYSDSYEYDVVGTVDGTFTFGNPQLLVGGVEYEIVSGSATWHETGHLGAVGQLGYCSWSKSGTEDGKGKLTVFDDGSGQLTYEGWGAALAINVPTGCPQTMSVISARNFFYTCVGPNFPLTGLDLSGSCQIDRPPNFNLVTEHEEYNWHLSGISCSAAAAVTPQAPVCGGAAAGP